MHAHEEGAPEGPAEYPLGKVAGGEPPGEWLILGQNPLELAGLIAAEGPSGEAFRKLLNHLRDPRTGEQLGRAPISNQVDVQDRIEDRVKRWRRRNKLATPEQETAYRIKTASDSRKGVHAWDATFSVPKSWSVLWAALTWAGRHDEAEQLWQAIEAGVRAALEQLFEELSFTRHGTAGPKQADGQVTTDYRHAVNLMTAMFRHHVSRERDPNLHVHVMLLNRLLTESGAWHALYSGALLRSKPQLDATFQRVAESEAARLLGLSFVRNPDTPWREIEGVSVDVRDHFSSRSRALSARAEEKALKFFLRYGVKPTARQRWQMRQQANLETRRAKAKDAPALEEDAERWAEETQAAAVAHFEDVLATVDEIVALAADDEVPSYDEDEVIAQGIADLERESSVFNYARLSHAISQRLPDHIDVESAEIRALVTRLTDKAIAARLVVSTKGTPVLAVPASMRHDDGSGRSRFDGPDSWKFTTTATLATEESWVARLDHRGARSVPVGSARALLAETNLLPEQTEVAVGVLTSDRALEVVNAAAGTGKSVTVKAISDVCEQVFGTGVVGFTVSESAAMVLRREGVPRAHNIERWMNYVDREAEGRVSDTERAQFAVPAGGVAVVDEATMPSTAQLNSLVSELYARGVNKVVLVGDTAQVDAVGAGGAFAMLVREAERRELEALAGLPSADDFAAADVAAWTGGREREPVRVHRMEQVRRFTHRWERDASRGLREGKAEAVAQYEARGRVRGDQNHDRVRDWAARGLVTDWLAGRDSIIVTGTTEEADDLSSRVRQRLVEAGHVIEDGVRVRGHNTAGVGDVVQSRLNDHQVGVLNRDRWQVVGTTDNGELHVRQILGPNQYSTEVRVLEPTYVRRQVELGYAGTVHAVEGVTIKGGTAHQLVGRHTGASHAYVGGTRATEANHFYVELEDGETATGRLASIFADDDHAKAARVEMEDAQLREQSLGHLFVLWETAVREARAVSHRDVLTHVLKGDAQPVLADPASYRLFGLLRQAEITGHDPRGLVAQVVGKRRAPLATADSPASALYARVADEMKVAGLGEPVALSFENRVPAPRRGVVESEDERFARQLGRIIDDRKAQLALEASLRAPEWAVRACGPVPEEPGARLEWMGRVENAAALREAQGFTDERDAIGRRPTHVEPERCWLWDRAAHDIGMPDNERNLAGLSDGALLNRVADYERQLAWMPRNVDTDLKTAYLALQDRERRLVEARTAALDTAQAVADVDEMGAWVERLEYVAQVRADAVVATEPERRLAEDAQRELDRRAEVDRARDGIPLPVEPDEFEPEPEAELEPVVDPELEREEREADIRAAVFGWWSGQRQPDEPGVEVTPVFGSSEWVGLPDEAPGKWQAAVDASMARWRMGEPVDRQALADELAASEADVEPLVDLDPDALLEVQRWAQQRMAGVDEVPELYTQQWLEAGEEQQAAAVAGAALEEWNLGDNLTARQERLGWVRDVESSHAIARDLVEAREAAHRERVEVERAERAAEVKRAATAERRPFGDVEVTPEERSVDGLAGAEMAYRDPDASEAHREMGRLFLESQGIEPDAEVEVEEPEAVEVVWPEPAPIPQPEVEPEPLVEAFDDERERQADPEREDADTDPGERRQQEVHEAEPTTPGAEPEPAPVEAEPVVWPEVTPPPQPEPVPQPEPEPVVDVGEETRRQLVEAAREHQRQQEAQQAEEQRQQTEAAAAERAETERREQETAGQREARERAERDAQLQRDVQAAEKAAAILAERQAADEARREAEQQQRGVEAVQAEEPQVEAEV